MHNKLFLADGRAAVVGGRNLTDAYFMRSAEGNYFDFDLLCVGQVAADLGASFDTYWNSRFAVPLAAVASAADSGLDAAQRRASFDRLSASNPRNRSWTRPSGPRWGALARRDDAAGSCPRGGATPPAGRGEGGLHERGLAADGRSTEFRLSTEPAPPWWQRLRLWLLSRLVPDDLL